MSRDDLPSNSRFENRNTGVGQEYGGNVGQSRRVEQRWEEKNGDEEDGGTMNP